MSNFKNQIDLVDKISNSTGINSSDVEAFVNAFFKEIEKELHQNSIVEIEKLGLFRVIKGLNSSKKIIYLADRKNTSSSLAKKPTPQEPNKKTNQSNNRISKSIFDKPVSIEKSTPIKKNISSRVKSILSEKEIKVESKSIPAKNENKLERKVRSTISLIEKVEKQTPLSKANESDENKFVFEKKETVRKIDSEVIDIKDIIEVPIIEELIEEIIIQGETDSESEVEIENNKTVESTEIETNTDIELTIEKELVKESFIEPDFDPNIDTNLDYDTTSIKNSDREYTITNNKLKESSSSVWIPILYSIITLLIVAIIGLISYLLWIQ